uniref:Insulin-like peptide INSL6 n=1 Tax=Castor canadensis TaxID=51338 RepID=A0A8B7VDE9_CASCN|nr:insulin-like peptide INSL6 [Castor canadensis]
MSHFLSLCLLWLGFLLVPFSRELNQDVGLRRKLCGRHLLREILELCGHTNWSHFHFEGTPLAELISEASQKVEALSTDDLESPQTPLPVWETVTNPASTSTSQEEVTNNWEIQSQPVYQYTKIGLFPDKTTEISSSHDVNPSVQSVHKSMKFQKKSGSKMKALSNLFWGTHPQRKRRGYSDKCCLKGCTKEELGIACLPYIHF